MKKLFLSKPGFLGASITGVAFALGFILSCGSEKSFDNPVDPQAPSYTGTVTETSKTAAQPSGTTGPCLLDDCTAAESTTWVLPESNYFTPASATCSLGGDPMAVVSKQLNMITVIYRANYTSLGLYQLYARRFTVAEDGSMTSLDTTPVNLYPECYGNTSGVTGFSVSGYKSSVGTATLAAHSQYDAANQNITHFKVSVTCVNTAQSGSKTFNITSGIQSSVEATTAYSSPDGSANDNLLHNYPAGNGVTLSNFASGRMLFDYDSTFGAVEVTSNLVRTFKSGVKQTESQDLMGSYSYIFHASGRSGRLLLISGTCTYNTNTFTPTLASFDFTSARYVVRNTTPYSSSHCWYPNSSALAPTAAIMGRPAGWYGKRGILLSSEGKIKLTPEYFDN